MEVRGENGEVKNGLWVGLGRILGNCEEWRVGNGGLSKLAFPILTTVTRKTLIRRTFDTGRADKSAGIGYSCHSN
ncbi:MAG: hypothetical protein RL240_1673 [Planctomycetota bacterium]